jgi:hypothetical protein
MVWNPGQVMLSALEPFIYTLEIEIHISEFTARLSLEASVVAQVLDVLE